MFSPNASIVYKPTILPNLLIIMLHSPLNCCRATSTTGPSREQPRCLGAALAVALHLLAAPIQHASASESLGSDALPVPQACRPSRVLLVTTGPATKVGQPGTMLHTKLTPKGAGFVFSSFFSSRSDHPPQTGRPALLVCFRR